MKAILTQAAMIFLPVLLLACSPQQDGGDVLRIGLLPDKSEHRLRAQYEPLFQYLAESTGTDYEIVYPASYSDLLRLFHDREIGLAYFGGVTFVKAYLEDQAIPLVMRDVDARFTSLFLVQADHSASSLEDLKGVDFSFGSELSTSGHLMPRYFLARRGIEAESFFNSVSYSGAHDTTAKWVEQGKITAGVANAQTIKRMFQASELDPLKVRILWETPPYPNYVWALHPSIDGDTGEILLQAFTALDAENPEHRKILESSEAGNYYPATAVDFEPLIEIMRKMGAL